MRKMRIRAKGRGKLLDFRQKNMIGFMKKICCIIIAINLYI